MGLIEKSSTITLRKKQYWGDFHPELIFSIYISVRINSVVGIFWIRTWWRQYGDTPDSTVTLFNMEAK